MRIDKFLKVSRIIKRRTIANEVCDRGRVTINGKVAKPGTEVKEGDIIKVTTGPKTISIEVLAVIEHAVEGDSKKMYRIMDE